MRAGAVGVEQRVSETLVAQWAGHSVSVPQKIRAKCLVGEEDRAKRQIEEAHRAL